MFKNVLKSLSVTELVQIGRELNDIDIPLSSIINQLESKSNQHIDKSNLTKELLISEVIDEFSSRLLSLVSESVD